MRIVPFLFLFHLAWSTHAQKLTIELNLSNAEKTLEILNSETREDKVYHELVQLEATKALIKKLETSDTLLIKALKQTVQNKGLVSGFEQFQYHQIKMEKDSLRSFVSHLKKEGLRLSHRLDQNLSKFLPEEKPVKIELVGILGGNASGYTFGDADKFYLSLHHMGGDLDYLFDFCQHEIFHNIQAIQFDAEHVLEQLKGENAENKDYILFYLVNSLFSEGTATYIDDWENKPLTKANETAKRRNTVNKNRLKSTNYMFDRLIVALEKEPTWEGLNALYRIFFTTQFDEAGYYLGKVITTYTLQAGDNTLLYYLKNPPTLLLLDYFEHAKNDPDAPLKFTERFMEIIRSLHHKVKLTIQGN